MTSKCLGLLTVGLMAVTCGANAATVTLQPDDGKDAQIAGGNNAGMNFGDNPFIVTNWSLNERSIGLVEFDLSSVPSGALIGSATLSLFHWSNACNGCRYDIFRVTSVWEESTVTLNTAPAFDSTAVASLVISDSSTFLFRSWDVTSLVAGWVSGTYANYGLWIEEIPLSGTANAYFSSSDNDAGQDPRLSINYCNQFPGGGSTGGCFPGPGPFPAPEPGTLALLGLGLLGLGVTRRKAA